MELLTREIQTNQVGKKVISQFLLDEDFNVPDSKRDVERIIASEGTVKIEDMKMTENYVKVTGKLEFQVLYVGEGLEASLCSMAGSLPFEEKIYVEDMSGIYEVKYSRVELQTMMIHSRKLRVKSMIELEIEAEKQTIEVLPEDVQNETPIFKKKREIELLKLHLSKRDTYRIKEEIVLPESKECIGTLLWSDITNRKLDTKLEKDERVLSILDHFMKENKVVCAICAAPTILGKQGYLEGKNYTCFTSMNEDFKGTYVDEYAIMDGNIITGRSAAAVIDFAFLIIEKLCGIDKANEVKKAIYY